jgi:hypothetical protein
MVGYAEKFSSLPAWWPPTLCIRGWTPLDIPDGIEHLD